MAFAWDLIQSQHPIEHQCQKSYLRAFTSGGDSKQPVHSRSVMRIFTGRILDSQKCKTLRKQAYIEILQPKKDNFQIKLLILKILQQKKGQFSNTNSDIFHILAQNIDCGYLLELPTIYVFKQNMKNKVYPCKPQFNYIKVGFKGVKLYRHVFVMIAPCGQRRLRTCVNSK